MKRKLMIYFTDFQEKEKITYSLKMAIRKAIEATLDRENFIPGAVISVFFENNEGVESLIDCCDRVDTERGFLCFPLAEFDEGETLPTDKPEVMMGDIFMSLEGMIENAKKYGHPIEHEAAIVCSHATLHLLGHNHTNQEYRSTEMGTHQIEILSGIGIDASSL